MSKYTTEVRFICETEAGYIESKGYSNIDEIIQKAIPKIFSFNFPIFDEAYKNILCTKILRHYYTREISEETYSLWKLRLQTKLNEIMPYYNQMYKSELLVFNPLYDTSITTEHIGTTGNKTDATGKIIINKNGNNKENSNDSNLTEASTDKTDYDLFSETPQGSLQNVENETYLTNARKKKGSENTNVNFNGKSDKNGEFTEDETHNSISGVLVDGSEEYTTKVLGKTGGESYSRMLQEFRMTFLNIDLLIIDELNSCFMGIW